MPGGRPKKRTAQAEGFTAIADASMGRITALSADIAQQLNISPGTISDELAQIANGYELNAQIQQNGHLIAKRQGRRPQMHVAALLADCAKVHQRVSGESASEALRHIGGWAEEEGKTSAVTDYAKAVLGALGISRPQSWRTQVRRALERV